MTRMPIDDRLDGPEHELYDDETPPRSILSATWFRALLVVIVVIVVGAISAPYIFDAMNPSAKGSVASRAVPAPTPSAPGAPTAPAAVSAPAPSAASPGATSASAPVSTSPGAAPPSTPPGGAASATSTSPTSPPTGTSPSATSPSSAPPSSSSPGSPPPSAISAQADKPSNPTVAATTDTKPTDTPAVAPTKRIAASTTTASGASGSGEWWVQVGAFRNEATAGKVVARLRAQNYSVEQLRSGGDRAAGDGAAPAPGADASQAAVSESNPAGVDQYDVFVAGVSTSELNRRLAAKGLAAHPSGGGSVVKPSLPLRDAVSLSKDLAVDGLKVQVRRASAAAPASPVSAKASPAPRAGDTLYRVRVGAFPDRATALATLKELEAKGYAPFIARGAP